MSVSLALFSVLLGLLTYIVFAVYRRFHYWQSLGIACEKPHFVLGNLKGVVSKYTFAEIWQRYYKNFKGTGPFAGFYWFVKPAVFVLDVELVKLILIKEFSKFTDRGFFTNEKDDPLTGQLFALDGPRWRVMRNKLSPTFTSGKMKCMFPTVINVGREFLSVFEGMVQQDSVVEVKDVLARFTLDVIGTCAFGIDCNSLHNPDAEFRVMGKKALVDKRHGPVGIALFSSFPDFARKLGMKMTPEHIEEFFLRIVRETVAIREQNNVRRNDFMDMLIDLKNNKALKSETGEEMTNLTIEQVTAQAYVFLIAGFETSATTMGFALYELAQHEDIQQKARDEVKAVLEQHNGELTYECMKELQYLDQVISESLRLYTVLPVLNRKCIEDFEVPWNPKFVIKKGMNVLIPAAAIHRDAELYPNPDAFNPDNYSPEAVKERDSVEYLPFGDGPRNCVGMRFGLMQTRIGLALLLKNFKFSVCEKTQIPLEYDKENYLLSTKTGIFLKVERL